MPFDFVISFGQKPNGIGLMAMQLLIMPLRGNHLEGGIGGPLKCAWNRVAGRCSRCRTAPAAEERQGAEDKQTERGRLGYCGAEVVPEQAVAV